MKKESIILMGKDEILNNLLKTRGYLCPWDYNANIDILAKRLIESLSKVK